MNSTAIDAAELADQLTRELDRAEPLLRARSDSDAMVPRKPGAWASKQILGHLLDSAFNNHQRFVLTALKGSYQSDGYEQERWVQLHRYEQLDWVTLINLWIGINRFIAHTIRQIPQERLTSLCQIGGAEPMTLHALIVDYHRHLRHHLDQVEESFQVAQARK